ncbi:MAG: L-serine ammonia-lyase [Candidatus Melainabacteria bacterium]|nr:L-serine ammonia-lyase [Candidatus Melainabacteria bacterium]
MLRADLISPLDMFKIGIGPSSSHTVGPMVAAYEFRNSIKSDLENRTEDSADSASAPWHIVVELYGSLSATGKGHATDGAICAGLLGMKPKDAPPDEVWQAKPDLEKSSEFQFENKTIKFQPNDDIKFLGWLMDNGPMPHPNTMRFFLYKGDEVIRQEIWLSVGGGFVEQFDPVLGQRISTGKWGTDIDVPYPYNTAHEFIEQCERSQLKAWDVVIANQVACGLTESELRDRLREILDVMENCINSGIQAEGILPGGLNVRRRAKALHEKMTTKGTPAWAGNDLRPSVYAMAVNEENAAGGKVVTAPTNGSSGLIPAVWRTLQESHNLTRETLENGLIVASVIGALVKVHASISGAEVGCQGEVGTSCAMAAAGAVAMLGGTVLQLEQAAEIGIEHHLGMTCDPIMGLVQVPCIERNAMGAVKALNAAALSLAGDGNHLISLDKALSVMKQTGLDMNEKYKETSTGGLALG